VINSKTTIITATRNRSSIPQSKLIINAMKCRVVNYIKQSVFEPKILSFPKKNFKCASRNKGQEGKRAEGYRRILAGEYTTRKPLLK
jgi:hypothetical protein